MAVHGFADLERKACKMGRRSLLEHRKVSERKLSMKKFVRFVVPLLFLVANIAVVGPAALASTSHGHVGEVYTMTNDPSGNEVAVFDRAADGTLTLAETVATGGNGSGGGTDPLASQNSLVVSRNGKWLLAVNAGSNDISVFRIGAGGLKLTDTVESGGTNPVSVAIASNRVYVLNNGAPANIIGFVLRGGHLTPIPHSTRSLGAGDFGQVGFDNSASHVIITDKADSELLVYRLSRWGIPSADPVTTPSSGTTPFGFTTEKSGRILVVEVNGGNGAVSSYRVKKDGALQLISGSVVSGQAAACWIASDGRGLAFTTNPGSPSLSSYGYNRKGAVTLLDATAATGAATLDAGVTRDGRFLYALNPGDGGIQMYRVGHDGSLTDLGLASGGLAGYAQGLAVGK